MTDYNIRVVIDPGQSQSGSRAVRTELQGIQTEATRTQEALGQATKINPSAAQQGAGAIDAAMQKVAQSAERLGATTNQALSFNVTPAVSGLTLIGKSFSGSVQGAESLRAALGRSNESVYNAASASEKAAAALNRQAAAEAAVANGAKAEAAALNTATVSSRQHQQATLQAGQQFQDFAQQVTLGINPVTAFTQQAGQMAFAMSNMGGVAGQVGRFLGTGWGTLVLVGVSVLGQFISKMIEAQSATNDAADALDDFSKQMQEMANFVDLATGKIIKQTDAVRRLTLAQRENRLEDERKAAQKSSDSAFGLVTGRGGAADTVETGKLLGIETKLDADKLRKAAQDANGDVGQLIKNLDKLGPAYKHLGDTVAIAGDRSITFAEAQKRIRAETEALNGRTKAYMDTVVDYQVRQVQLANATTEVEKAQNRLRTAEESYRNLLKARGSDQSQVENARKEYDAALKATNQAKQDENNARAAAAAAKRDANAAQREQANYSEAIRRLRAESDLVTLYGREYEIRKAQISVEQTLRRGLGEGEAKAVRSIVELNIALKDEGDALRSIKQPIEDYQRQIAALTSLLEQGKISQAEFNTEVANLPLAKQMNAVDQTLEGTLFKYQAQLDAIDASIKKAIQTVNAAEAAGLINPDEAAARRVALNGNPAQNGEFDPTKSSAQSRAQAELDRQKKEQLNQFDQGLGGKIGRDAEYDAIQLKYNRDLAELKKFLGEKYITEQEYAKRKQALDRKMAQDERQYTLAERATRLASASGMFDKLAGLAEEYAGKQSAIYKVMFATSKAFAIAESIVHIQAAIAKAADLHFPANLAAIATVVAETASILSNIRAVTLTFRDGGYVNGKGGPRDDKNLALVSNGEFIMNAQATSRNRPILEAMNNGQDAGGASPGSMTAVMGGGTTIVVGDIHVAVESTGDAQQDGQLVGEEVRRALKGIVRDELVNETRSGGLLTKTRQSVMAK